MPPTRSRSSMPPLAPNLARTGVAELRATAHIQPPDGWFRQNAAIFGTEPNDTEALLLRRTASGRQVAALTIERLGSNDDSEEIHVDYVLVRLADPLPRRTEVDREYDSAVRVVMRATGPTTSWRLMSHLILEHAQSAITLPAPMVVGPRALEIRGFRLRGWDDIVGSFDVVIDKPTESLIHHVSFRTSSSLSDEAVSRWIDHTVRISKTFIVAPRVVAHGD